MRYNTPVTDDPIEDLIRAEVRAMLKDMSCLAPSEKRFTAQAIASLFSALKDADTGDEDGLQRAILDALKSPGPRLSEPDSEGQDQ
jgi:hypothetical protein